MKLLILKRPKCDVKCDVMMTKAPRGTLEKRERNGPSAVEYIDIKKRNSGPKDDPRWGPYRHIRVSLRHRNVCRELLTTYYYYYFNNL